MLRRLSLYANTIAAFFLVPFVALASPLVSCGLAGGLTPGSQEYLTAITNCNLCSMTALVQSVINFLLGLTIPIAVVMFAWAGIVFFTSAENAARRDNAKKIFRSVFLGFVLALCGWLIVQTILSIVVTGDFWFGGSWNSLGDQCVDSQRPRNATVNDLLNSVLPELGTNTDPAVQEPTYGDDNTPQCNTGYSYYPTTGQCVADTTTGGGATGFSSEVTNQAGDASPALNNLIDCMAAKTTGTITSISDNNGGVSCYQDHPTWIQCTNDNQTGCCFHAKNSCHYGGVSCQGSSYAVDIKGDNAAIKAAASSCNADYILDEEDHVHSSVGASCGCN